MVAPLGISQTRTLYEFVKCPPHFNTMNRKNPSKPVKQPHTAIKHTLHDSPATQC